MQTNINEVEINGQSECEHYWIRDMEPTYAWEKNPKSSFSEDWVCARIVCLKCQKIQ